MTIIVNKAQMIELCILRINRGYKVEAKIWCQIHKTSLLGYSLAVWNLDFYITRACKSLKSEKKMCTCQSLQILFFYRIQLLYINNWTQEPNMWCQQKFIELIKMHTNSSWSLLLFYIIIIILTCNPHLTFSSLRSKCRRRSPTV